MERIVERPAAPDVHKASVTACVRTWHGRRLEERLEQFPTTVKGLLTLADWLESHQATTVAMEATGVYRKPVWAVLEDGFDLLLVNARHVKQVPGRKTDVLDARWLCQLLEAGLLRGSLVPPKPIRTLPNPTRCRKTQIQARQRETLRLHEAIEDTGITLGRVATDITGKSGRAMLGALVAGITDPEALADLARGSCEGSFRRCARRWRGASRPSTGFSSASCWPTSTSSTRRASASRRRSPSRSPRSRRPASCWRRSRA